jgi:hypothetical protein
MEEGEKMKEGMKMGTRQWNGEIVIKQALAI